VSDQALLAAPGRDGVSAQLQERIRAFTSFYEQHAYLAYNLALRITCAPEPAAKAVQIAFLRQLDDSPSGLVTGTVGAALREFVERPEPGAAGDAQAQALLVAISTLAPAERAALAMADLAHAGADEIGEALGLPGDQAAKLVHRCRDAFATATGLSRIQADEAARDWMWAAPPNDVWEELYQRFHRTVERQLRQGPADHTLVLRAESASAPAQATRAAKRRLRRTGRRRWRLLVRRPGWRLALVALVVLAGAGAGAAQLVAGKTGSGTGAGQGSSAPAPLWGDPAPSQAATSGPQVSPHKPLTAALLDKLRLRELSQLRAYGKRQADTSLPARQRQAASQRIAALERAARDRILAQQRRDAALRDLQARQRAQRRAAPPPPPASTPTPRSPSTSTPPRTQRPQPQPPATHQPPGNRHQADQTCLMDQNTGQYICPQ
jgi:hypothetical protein